MTITSSPLLSPDDVARHSFTLVRRGFDPKEVRAYLESLAHGVAGLAQREQELLENLAATERRAANPVLDEQTLMGALGQETARVLHSAHEAAQELETKAREEAERLVTESTERAEAARSAAETLVAERTADAESTATRRLEAAEARATELIDAAARDGDELRARTKDECRAMIEEAQQLRARVLADLARRRRLLHAQIDQLRAGRERLAETIDGVRRSVDGIADDLSTAEDSAREAAESAGRAAAERGEDEEGDELAVLLQAAASGGSTEAAATRAAGESGETGTPPAEVEALFAKLRAEEDEASGSRDDPGTGAEAGGTGAGEVEVEVETAEVVVLVTEEVLEVDDGTADETDAGPPADRPPVVIRRDELVAPIVTSLARRLKRTLQDNQNDLLDQLRSHGSAWSPAVLPDEKEQLDGFATAVLPVLEEAAQAGATFAGGAGASGPSTDAVVAVAHGLAEEVVGPLRRRLSSDDGVADAGETAAVEHVGTAFRDWRGSRVERLAGDHVVAAFSLGSVVAVQGMADGRLEWIAVPGSGDTPCPDCEDNGLAGPQPPGDEFPTGHRHPPAHSGCRCLITSSAP